MRLGTTPVVLTYLVSLKPLGCLKVNFLSKMSFLLPYNILGFMSRNIGLCLCSVWHILTMNKSYLPTSHTSVHLFGSISVTRLSIIWQHLVINRYKSCRIRVDVHGRWIPEQLGHYFLTSHSERELFWTWKKNLEDSNIFVSVSGEPLACQQIGG